jgi:hypothetical protein
MGSKRKDLEACTTPVCKQLKVDDVKAHDFNCSINIIPENTCCFLRLSKLHNDTQVRVAIVIYY